MTEGLSGELPNADRLQRSIRGSLAAALDAVGLSTASTTSDSARDRALLGLPAADRVCFVLVDGLGWFNLQDRIGHAATLRSWHAFEPLSSVMPSTTAAAITSVGTAEFPGRTAMLSYALRSPNTGQNFSLITWQDSDMDPVAWQTTPTVFEQLGEHARECVLIQEQKFVGSGLTLCALRGADTIVAEKLEDRVSAAARALRQGKRAAYLYWGELDHVGHHVGSESGEWTAALEAFDAEMRHLARAVPRGTLIVVTADHGMVDVAERYDIAADTGLTDGVTLVSGEERALHLYTPEPDAVAHRWREILGSMSCVMTKDDAVAARIFGDVTDFSYSVLGDVLVFQGGEVSLYDSRGRDPQHSFMVGVHGSFTEREMTVPWLVEIA